MSQPLTVALYGRSLMLDGLGHRLSSRPRLRVVPVEGETLAEALGAFDPDALFFDLGSVKTESALALLLDRPRLLLVGLEASGARVLVLAGDHARSLGTDDLVGLIDPPAVDAGVGDR